MTTRTQVIIALSFIFIALVFWISNYQGSEQGLEISDREAVLILDYGNGKERAFAGELMEGMTVWHALQAASEAGSFPVQAASFKPELKLVSIDNKANNDTRHWQAYVNDIKLKGNPVSTVITEGDEILWRYE